MFVLWGTGRNGKTTFLKTLQGLLADYAGTCPTQTLMTSAYDRIPNDLAKLHGPRFVTASEGEAHHRLAEARIKQLTGGDVVSARFLYGELFDYIPAFKLWFLTNYKPRVKGTDLAIWRRLRLIPFSVTSPEAEVDLDFGAKLLGELGGILAWALRGCLSWQKVGLAPPAIVVDATTAYQLEEDQIGRFIAERCKVGPKEKAAGGELFLAYKAWCDENGEVVESTVEFGRALDGRGFKVKKSGKRIWHGVGIRAWPPATL